jgi:hypothetical protein
MPPLLVAPVDVPPNMPPPDDSVVFCEPKPPKMPPDDAG